MNRLKQNSWMILAALFVLVATSGLAAQVQPWLTQPRTPEQMLADQLVAMSRVTLAGDAEPTESQRLIARVMFDLALELVGDDPELWRLRAELARIEDDESSRTNAWRKYTALNPSDDAAQLQLILERIAQEQTLDERLKLLERLLQSKNASALSSPLRSRLASLAASAADELGDSARYATWLKEALRLDPANTDAAAMTYEYTLARTQDTVRVGAALVNLVRTGPANPQARLELARLMFKHQAYQTAIEQFQMAVQLTQGPLSEPDWHAFMISSVALGHPEDALASITNTEKQIKQYAQALEKQGESAPTTELPASTEMLRLVIETVSQNTAAAKASYDKLQTRLAQAEDKEADALLLAAIFNQEADKVRAALNGETVANDVRSRLAAWLALHNGELNDAAEKFAAIETQDGWTVFGHAMAQSNPNNRDKKLLEAMQFDPVAPSGLMAVMRLRELRESNIEPTSEARSLITLMEKSPARLWYTDLAMSPWYVMRCDVPVKRARYLEPIEAVITLRNISGVPLAVGAQDAVPTRAWLTVEPTIAGQPMSPVPPIVANLGRQLVIGVGESAQVRVRLDQGSFGQLIASNPGVTLNWRVATILDPRANSFGGIVPGPIGAKQTVGSLLATGLPVTAANIDIWLEDIASDHAPTQFTAFNRLFYAINNLPDDVDRDATRQRIAEAINAAYPNLDRVHQAWVARFLQLAGEQKSLFQRVIDLVERTDDPLVRLPYTMTQAIDPQANALLSALRHEDPRIRRFAEALREEMDRAEAARELAEPAIKSP